MRPARNFVQGVSFLILFIPIVLILEDVEESHVAAVAGAGDGAFLDCLEDRTALLLGVGAFFVAASTDVGGELAEGAHEILLAHEVKSLEIQHGKAGGVCEIAAVGVIGQRVKLHRSGGVLSALNAVGEVSRLEIEMGEEAIEQGGFSHTRCARECRDLVRGARADVLLECFNSFSCGAHDLKHRESCAAVNPCKSLGHFLVAVSLGHDQNGVDAVEFCDAEQLVQRFGNGIGGGCRRGDVVDVEIRHGGPDQGAATGKDLLHGNRRAVRGGDDVA